MNYEIEIYENTKTIVVIKAHNHYVSESEIKYKSYGFGHLTNYYDDGPKALIIETQDGGENLYNLENISSIIYK